MKWIKCSERMPASDKESIVLVSDGKFIEALYIFYDVWDDTNYLEGKITHWMPLPEPPPEENV